MCVDSELPDADYLLCGDWWNYYHCLLGLPVLLLQVWGLWVSVCSHRSRSWEQNKLSCLFSILFVHIVPVYGYFRLLACSPFLKPALVSAAALHIQNHSVYFPRSLFHPLLFCPEEQKGSRPRCRGNPTSWRPSRRKGEKSLGCLTLFVENYLRFGKPKQSPRWHLRQRGRCHHEEMHHFPLLSCMLMCFYPCRLVSVAIILSAEMFLIGIQWMWSLECTSSLIKWYLVDDALLFGVAFSCVPLTFFSLLKTPLVVLTFSFALCVGSRYFRSNVTMIIEKCTRQPDLTGL